MLARGAEWLMPDRARKHGADMGRTPLQPNRIPGGDAIRSSPARHTTPRASTGRAAYAALRAVARLTALGPVDIRLHAGDSPRARNRIQDWKTETSLGPTDIERRTMGAGCAAASRQAWRSRPLRRRQPAVSRSGFVDCPDRLAVARSACRVRELEFDLPALPKMGIEGRVRKGFQ